MSDSDKGEDMVAVSLDFLYNEFDDPGAAHEIVWSDGFMDGFIISI